MKYCTLNDVRLVLPEKITIGTTNIGTPNPGRPGVGANRSAIDEKGAEQLILVAEQYIDGKLFPFYLTPLRKVNVFEMEGMSDISRGRNVEIEVPDPTIFLRSQYIRIQDKYKMETCTISQPTQRERLIVDRVEDNYSLIDDLQITMMDYPDPIPVTTARLTASYIYDRLHVAEQAPDVSHYGRTLRNMATMAIDDILRGITILKGQEHTGRRFIRVSLLDKISTPADVTKGEEKEG